MSRSRCRTDRRFAEPTPRALARRRHLPPFTVTGTHPVVLVPSTGTAQAAFKLGLLGGVGRCRRRGGRRCRHRQPRRRGAPHVHRNRRRKSRARRVRRDAQSRIGRGHDRLCLQAGCFAARERRLRRGRDGVRSKPRESAGHRYVHDHRAAVEWGGGDPARVAFARRGGTLAIGKSITVAISRPGQNARLTFAATAGTLLALQFLAVTTNPAGHGLVVRRAPAGQDACSSTHASPAPASPSLCRRCRQRERTRCSSSRNRRRRVRPPQRCSCCSPRGESNRSSAGDRHDDQNTIAPRAGAISLRRALRSGRPGSLSTRDASPMAESRSARSRRTWPTR